MVLGVQAGDESMLTKGAGVWLPCQVKPGPFSDERMVLVELDGAQWFGFVNERWLYQKVATGEDHVLGKVVDVTTNGTFSAMIPGNAPGSSTIEGSVDKWTPVSDPLQARHHQSA